jgi:uncharacterized protein (DUF697 family)
VIGLLPIPGADMPVMTANQARMVCTWRRPTGRSSRSRGRGSSLGCWPLGSGCGRLRARW